MTELGWGRRYLMCPPDHFGVMYEINPWMHREITVDRDLAYAQWEGLVTNLTDAGAAIDLLDPHPDWPDLVFTANAGIVTGRRFIPGQFQHPERQGETPLDIAWFEANGFTIAPLPTDLPQEGAGDALPMNGLLLAGYRTRSAAQAHGALAEVIKCEVLPLELVDERLYHLDLTFCPLDDRRAIVAPLGWDAYGRKVIERVVPEPLVLDDEAALGFCANSVVVGQAVIMPSVPPGVGRQLEGWGFSPVETPVGEFLKAGGGCRCLTLALDVKLGVDA